MTYDNISITISHQDAILILNTMTIYNYYHIWILSLVKNVKQKILDLLGVISRHYLCVKKHVYFDICFVEL